MAARSVGVKSSRHLVEAVEQVGELAAHLGLGGLGRHEPHAAPVVRVALAQHVTGRLEAVDEVGRRGGSDAEAELSSPGPSCSTAYAMWLMAARSVGCIVMRRARAAEASEPAVARSRSATVSGACVGRPEAPLLDGPPIRRLYGGADWPRSPDDQAAGRGPWRAPRGASGLAGLAIRRGIQQTVCLSRASGGMADALASGASVRKGVGVQIPPRARDDERAPVRWNGALALSWGPRRHRVLDRRIWEDDRAPARDGSPLAPDRNPAPPGGAGCDRTRRSPAPGR